MKLNYIIVDPEKKMHKVIEDYCNELDYMNLKAHCYNADDSYEVIKNESIDIVFLDINLKNLDAFEFLRSLKKSIKIIVVTANVKDSLEGYEIDISELMLKPISLEKLVKSLKRMQTNLSQILINMRNKV